MSAEGLLIARGDVDAVLLPRMANRHGLIAGATGTGKTVTLQAMAEDFSRLGVPVFLADVKGDLSGMVRAGSAANSKVAERREQLGVDDQPYEGSPVVFWDVFGEQGLPIRATVTEMGPVLLGRILDLNDTQQAVLTVAFRVADDGGLLLLDLKDLRAIIQHVAENAKTLSGEYGNVAPATVAAIQRSLLHLEDQGGTKLFGEPALELSDILRTNADGRGIINVLAADKLLHSPKVYSTFLLWMLSELYQNLPEVGDLEKPKLVFFFDEAHLLFNDAPKHLLEKIEQVVRLIRSKGVGVFFATQNPIDVPEIVLGQLGNRVQHALRAFSARDKKAVKAAAETFRENPKLDVASAITELGIGEALVSFLDGKGMPGVVERAYVLPPRGQVGPIAADERTKRIQETHLYSKYAHEVDRESAYEILKKRAETATPKEEKEAKKPAARRGDDIFTAAAKSAARSAASSLGRSITRGILGSLFGSK